MTDERGHGRHGLGAAHRQRRGGLSATFRTGGSQTLTATDTANSAITGSITINASVVPIPTLSTWTFLLLALTALRALRLGRTF